MIDWSLQILETPEQMESVEALQRLVWTGSETDVVPGHILLAIAHNGGLVIGISVDESTRSGSGLPQLSDEPQRYLAGFVFGFPGLYATPDGPQLKHCSHMLAVHPDFRDQGLGFALKRAQWQMVRYQGMDRITWTYDPLLSRNAYLNIARLGAVCNTYLRDEYGAMRDELNAGLASDRFQVDWWVRSKRVDRRLGKNARLQLDLAHFLAAGAEIINPSQTGSREFPQPDERPVEQVLASQAEQAAIEAPLLLMEIPAAFQELRSADPALARAWRQHTRSYFEGLFTHGYLVTDFIYLPGRSPRSFYVLSHGESTF